MAHFLKKTLDDFSINEPTSTIEAIEKGSNWKYLDHNADHYNTTTLTITTLQHHNADHYTITTLQHHNADHYTITTSNTRVTGQVEASIMMKASYTVSRISTSDTYFLFQLSDIFFKWAIPGLFSFIFVFSTHSWQ